MFCDFRSVEKAEKATSIASSVGLEHQLNHLTPSSTQSLYRNPQFLFINMNSTLQKWYEQKYKLLMLIPLILVLLALIQIGTQYATTGDFVHRGITLKGGSTVTIHQDSLKTPITSEELKSDLHTQFNNVDLDVREISSAGKVIAIAIDSELQTKEEINSLLTILETKLSINQNELSVEVVGSAIGDNFFRQMVSALIISFVLMGIVVLLYFRLLVPSFAVIAAAFSDIVVTLAIFNLTGIKLSTAGVAAFLMLIGYSVDTDVLLTTRYLKRKEGTEMDRIYSSIKTGLTMTATTLVAVTVALIFVQSEVVRQIMIILFIGLVVDTVMTWIQNVGILRWYTEHKLNKSGGKHHGN